MTLYIKIDENSNPIGNPYEESNLKQVFPNHDFSAPPAGWLEFIRKRPQLGVYQKFNENIGIDICQGYDHNGLEYKSIDGKIQDYWNYVEMTATEKKAKQDQVKANWATLDPAGPASWAFDEATCSYKAPVDLPVDALSPSNLDGKPYDWDEETTSWKEIIE
tara:strand:+ start:165 stop:650 length:486 start_codon:yes stop_codon:yes gene_type:complete